MKPMTLADKRSFRMRIFLFGVVFLVDAPRKKNPDDKNGDRAEDAERAQHARIFSLMVGQVLRKIPAAAGRRVSGRAGRGAGSRGRRRCRRGP